MFKPEFDAFAKKTLFSEKNIIDKYLPD